MQPPVMDDLVLELPDGRVFRAKPVMLMYYHIEEAGLDGTNMAHTMLDAMRAGLGFYHSEEEIYGLMRELSIVDVMNFLSPVLASPEGETEQGNFPDGNLEGLTDSMLTGGSGRNA